MSQESTKPAHGLIVIGVNRSGTSALAAAIKELGVYFGPTEDLPDRGLRLDYEPLENRHVVEIGGHLLRALEKDGVPARKMPENWEDVAGLADKVQPTAQFLSTYFSNYRLWGWKDPRTSLLIPFFESVFQSMGTQPTYLMPIRHPMEVAQGLLGRQGLPLTQGLGYWINFTLTALTELDPKRIELVPFRGFVKDPRSYLEPVWFSRGFGSPTTKDWQRVRAAVMPALDRTRDNGNNLPPFAEKCWNVVKRMASYGRLAPGSSELMVIHGLAREWQELSELTRLSAIAVGEVRWLVAGKTGSMAFSGEAVWHKCIINLPPRFSGLLDLWFLPRYRVVHVRKLYLRSPSGTVVVRTICREGAFVEMTTNSELKLVTFGPEEHLTVQIPPHVGDAELAFEFQISAGKQAALQNAQQLASALRAERTGPKKDRSTGIPAC